MSNASSTRRGMTVIELMVAIAIIAIVMSLAIGGIAKATQAVQANRRDAVKSAVYNALVAYRQYYGRWPGVDDNFSSYQNISRTDPSKTYDEGSTGTFKGVRFGEDKNCWQRNSQVLDDLLPDSEGNPKGRTFIDPAVLFVRLSNGRVVTLKTALEGDAKRGIAKQSQGMQMMLAPRTKPKESFYYITVTYNLDNDSVILSSYEEKSL